jgi:Activator of Hsp90 ATPase, N-terminal
LQDAEKPVFAESGSLCVIYSKEGLQRDGTRVKKGRRRSHVIHFEAPLRLCLPLSCLDLSDCLVGAAKPFDKMSSSSEAPPPAERDESSGEEGSGEAGAGGASKKHARHYAWNEKTSERKKELEELGANRAPIKLDASSPLPVPEASPAAHGAVWNAAQTFVTKDISKKVGPTMKESLSGKVLKIKGSGASHLAVRITGVPKCDGEASLAFSRGKARPGFELAVDLSFEVIPGISSASEEVMAVSAGTIKIEELADHESDLFESWSVSIKTDAHDEGACGGVSKDSLKSAIKTSAFAEDLRTLFRDHWVEALKKL